MTLPSFEIDALRKSEELLRAFLEHSPLVAFLKDDAGRYLYVNSRLEEVFGVAAADLYGRADVDWLPEATARLVRQNDQKVLATGATVEAIESVPMPDGRDHQWLVNKFLFTNAEGDRFVAGVALDVTTLKAAERLLRESEERYRHLIEHSQGLICTHDLQGQVLDVNPAVLTSLGYEASELVGNNLSDILNPAVRDEFPRYLERITNRGQDSGLMAVLTKAGQSRTWQYHNVLMPQAERQYVLGHAIDVTELRAAQEQLRTEAVTDELTGLLNRRGFFRRASRLLQRDLGRGQSHTAFFVDVDDLKTINDSFGHEAGSAAIVAAAEALQQTFRAADVIGRIGGDEFVVLAQVPGDLRSMIEQRLRDHVLVINSRRDPRCPLALSVGAAHLESGSGITLEELIRLADHDMYAKKRAR